MKNSGLGHIVMALMVAAGVSLAVSEANAGWRWHGSSGSLGSWGSHGSHGSSGSWGSHGSSGSWGSSGGYRVSYFSGCSSGSYGSSGSHGSHGSSGGLFSRWHGRHYSSHGSSGSYGSHGSFGSTGSTGSSGSYGSYGSYGSSVNYYYSQTATPSVYYGATSVNTGVEVAGATVEAANGLLVVSVPENAKVYVNDYLTKSTGTVRQFMSKGLVAGKTYNYDVRVEVDGQVQTKEVTLIGGQTSEVAFQEMQPTETTLAINVPADARITLEGNAMKSQGTIRVFTSTELKKGDTWSNYTVRVEVERNGEKMVKEEKIDLAAGDYKELSFEFEGARVAAK